MKKLTLSACLICISMLFTSQIYAQSMAALMTKEGRFMVSDPKASPPADVISVAGILEAAAVVILEDNKLSLLDGYKVKSFAMTITREGKNKTMKTIGNMITDEMKSEMKSIAPGDKLFIEYIKCEMPDKTTRSMPSLSFRIE